MPEFRIRTDYYQVLGVSSRATAAEIKSAFRRLAHLHHPDRRGDPEKFKDASAAYEILGDTDKRREYDAARERELRTLEPTEIVRQVVAEYFAPK